MDELSARYRMLRDWEDRLVGLQSQLWGLQLLTQAEDYDDVAAECGAAADHAAVALLEIVKHLQQVAPVDPRRGR